MRKGLVLGLVMSLVGVAFMLGCPSPKAPPPAPAATSTNAVTAPAGTVAGAGGDAESLCRTKCAKCHALDPVFAEKRTEADWTETVNGMRARKISWISEEEAAQITQWLIANHGMK
jgi:cytochrome c5